MLSAVEKLNIVTELQSSSLPLVSETPCTAPRWVALNTHGALLYSADGKTWQQGQVLGAQIQETTRQVAFGNGSFVAVGRHLLTSTDGICWHVRHRLRGSQSGHVAYSNGRWVCGTSNGTLLTSTDNGRTWRRQSRAFPGRILSVVAGKGIFVATGRAIDGRRMWSTSSDGRHWERIQVDGTPLKQVVYGNERFLGVDTNGHIHCSTDGVHWVQSLCPGNQVFTQVRAVNGVFLAITNHSGYCWSLEGCLWTSESGFLPQNVVYGGGTYVGRDTTGALFSARVLDAWDQQNTPAHDFIDFVYGIPKQGVQ